MDCIWGNWTDWTSCNLTCGGGKQERTRTIATNASNSGANCTGPFEEAQDCNTNACGKRRKRSFGVLEDLIDFPQLIRKRRDVKYRCNKTITYGILFYDIRNKEGKF